MTYYPTMPEHAYIIEVIDADHRTWTAMANVRDRIMTELRSAPAAVAITIYEWIMAEPVPRGKPVWKFVAKYPWTLDNGHRSH